MAFQLDLLVDCAELNVQSSSQGSRDARLKTMAQMLPVDLVPMLRAAFGLETTPEARAGTDDAWSDFTNGQTGYISTSVVDYRKGVISEEIVGAVDLPLAEREAAAINVRRRLDWWRRIVRE